jgi:putative sigma-54 modulation protein
MHTKFTARRFRARPLIKSHALDAVNKLDKFYDNIVTADIILSFEGATKNIKIAEVNLHVYGTVLSAKEKSDDYHKAIDAVVEKLGTQLERYKSKLRAKDKNKVRAIHDKV